MHFCAFSSVFVHVNSVNVFITSFILCECAFMHISSFHIEPEGTEVDYVEVAAEAPEEEVIYVEQESTTTTDAPEATAETNLGKPRCIYPFISILYHHESKFFFIALSLGVACKPYFMHAILDVSMDILVTYLKRLHRICLAML